MSYKKNEAELAFNQQYSRFKIIIYFRNRMPITHYGQERYHCTVAQIQFGYISQVVLHHERGLNDCLDRIALCEKYYGQYTTALIYDRNQQINAADGCTHTGNAVMKFKNGEVVEGADFCLTGKEKITILKVKRTGHLKFVLEQIEDNVPMPHPEKIDFKKEVAKAIEKPLIRQTSLVYKSAPIVN